MSKRIVKIRTKHFRLFVKTSPLEGDGHIEFTENIKEAMQLSKLEQDLCDMRFNHVYEVETINPETYTPATMSLAEILESCK